MAQVRSKWGTSKEGAVLGRLVGKCGVVYTYYIPLDPQTMKNEGFQPPIYGLQPLKMKVVGSHGILKYIYILYIHLPKHG